LPSEGGVVTGRMHWPDIVAKAADIVRSYDTGVTLRQLFYRLVADGTLPNTTTAYKRLSAVTAEARREGWFPKLIDRGRTIHRRATFDDVLDAQRWLANIYRRDRTEGQDVSLYLGVEKAGLVNQLEAWFGDLGVPVVALGGYSGQTLVDDVVGDVSLSGRPAMLLYAGDHDPSGEDIERDFIERTDCWAKVVRVALSAEQVATYRLPPQPGKATDARSAAFVARHGQLVQVELDALPPDVLRRLFTDAITEFWDTSAYERQLEIEHDDRAALRSGDPGVSCMSCGAWVRERCGRCIFCFACRDTT
jgi:hypothetical protein